MSGLDWIVLLVVIVFVLAVAEELLAERAGPQWQAPRPGDLVVYRRRLTPDGAHELGLMVNFIPSPWSEGGTHALAPSPNAPCQECWHRRDEHGEFEPMLCSDPGCACTGWDPFLDTSERAARA